MEKLIRSYFELTGKIMPDEEWEAMAFVITELAEIYEALLDTGRPYKRNNPDKDRPKNEDFSQEIGDAIMMLEVAALTRDESAVTLLTRKIAEHLRWVKGIYWVEIFNTREALDAQVWAGESAGEAIVGKAFDHWATACEQQHTNAVDPDADLFACGEELAVVIFEREQILV